MAKTWATKCCSGTYKNNYQLCCGIKDKYKVKIEKESLIIEGSDISDWQTDGETEDITVNDVPKVG